MRKAIAKTHAEKSLDLAVEAEMAAHPGMKRHDAVKAVFKAVPSLRQRLVDEVNAAALKTA